MHPYPRIPVSSCVSPQLQLSERPDNSPRRPLRPLAPAAALPAEGLNILASAATLVAPTRADVLGQAAAASAYVALYEAQCRFRQKRNIAHRHALYLMCRGASPMRALVQTGLSGRQVSMLLPGLRARGAHGAMAWLTHLDAMALQASRPTAQQRPLARPLRPHATRPAQPLPQPTQMLSLPRPTGVARADILLSAPSARQTTQRDRAQALLRTPRRPGPMRVTTLDQKRAFAALVDRHAAGISAGAMTSAKFVAMLCRGVDPNTAGDMACVSPAHAEYMLERLAELGPGCMLACIKMVPVLLSPPSLVAQTGTSQDAQAAQAHGPLPKLELYRLGFRQRYLTL